MQPALQQPLRIVLLSCAGAPFSAEICGHLEKIRPALLDQIVGVVLSKPRIQAIGRLPWRQKIRTVWVKSGVIGLLAELRDMLHYRCKNLWIKIERRIRRSGAGKDSTHYRRIEDFCLRRGITPYITRDVNDSASHQFLLSLQPDVLLMATFHCILKGPVIKLASKAALNVHASFLPHYRGADPINSALHDRAQETGVTIHWVDEGIDTGDIAAQCSMEIPERANEALLRPLLAELAAQLLVDCVDALCRGGLARRPQSI
jgi:folate-dependent phosphoribosylglycinamide formyltransferase PurN